MSVNGTCQLAIFSWGKYIYLKPTLAMDKKRNGKREVIFSGTSSCSSVYPLNSQVPDFSFSLIIKRVSNVFFTHVTYFSFFLTSGNTTKNEQTLSCGYLKTVYSISTIYNRFNCILRKESAKMWEQTY